MKCQSNIWQSGVFLGIRISSSCFAVFEAKVDVKSITCYFLLKLLISLLQICIQCLCYISLPDDGITLYILFNRVYDNWPLYDVLNLFQKDHSHMAVVIKSKEDATNTANSSIGSPSIVTISTNCSSYPVPADQRGNTSVIFTLIVHFFFVSHICFN